MFVWVFNAALLVLVICRGYVAATCTAVQCCWLLLFLAALVLCSPSPRLLSFFFLRDMWPIFLQRKVKQCTKGALDVVHSLQHADSILQESLQVKHARIMAVNGLKGVLAIMCDDWARFTRSDTHAIKRLGRMGRLARYFDLCALSVNELCWLLHSVKYYWRS